MNGMQDDRRLLISFAWKTIRSAHWDETNRWTMNGTKDDFNDTTKDRRPLCWEEKIESVVTEV